METPKKRQKYGGRKKGTPNKKTLLLQDQLEEKGLDPVAGLKACLEELEAIVAYEAEDQINLVNSKARIYIEILQYIYPKRKAVEYAVQEESPPQVIEVQWADEVKDDSTNQQSD